MLITQGEVYADPQTLQHYNYGHTETTGPADENTKANWKKPLLSKVKLIFPGDKEPTGHFKSGRTSVTAQIHFG